MQTAVIQHDIVWSDAPATRTHLEPLVAQAAAGGARLIVLTEMFATGFSMEPEQVAEAAGGPTEQWLSAQAAQHGVWIIGSIAQHGTHPGAKASDVRAVNVAVVAGPEGQSYRYEKMHPFTYGGEHEHYRPGDKSLTVDIDGVRTSVFICYDLRFADEFWALAYETDLYVVVANWPEARREHWRALLRARAIENQAYVIGANRVGPAGDRHKTGHVGDSTVIDPLGRTLVEAYANETTITASVDPAEVGAVRARFPFLDDRR